MLNCAEALAISNTTPILETVARDLVQPCNPFRFRKSASGSPSYFALALPRLRMLAQPSPPRADVLAHFKTTPILETVARDPAQPCNSFRFRTSASGSPSYLADSPRQSLALSLSPAPITRTSSPIFTTSPSPATVARDLAQPCNSFRAQTPVFRTP